MLFNSDMKEDCVSRIFLFCLISANLLSCSSRQFDDRRNRDFDDDSYSEDRGRGTSPVIRNRGRGSRRPRNYRDDDSGDGDGSGWQRVGAGYLTRFASYRPRIFIVKGKVYAACREQVGSGYRPDDSGTWRRFHGISHMKLFRLDSGRWTLVAEKVKKGIPRALSCM